MKKQNFFALGLLLFSLHSLNAWAWGRRGHQIVGETAALLASNEKNAGFLRDHSFDLAYYANVPDFIWKRPATYGSERTEHYMNLEIFDRSFAHSDVQKPYELSRKEFESKFPDIKPEAGRAYWRIRELYDRLSQITQQLRDLKEPAGAERQKLQEKWLVNAGVIAHYVGDLGMPLHISENHDGDMTGQKGVHSYFEDVLVNDLYPEIETEVNHEALKQWPAFKKKNSEKSVLQLMVQIAEHSQKAVPVMLALDKKSKREDIRKNAQANRKLIRDRMVDSSLALAEIYRRQTGWIFDDKKFYFFGSEPEYIQPGVPEAEPAKK